MRNHRKTSMLRHTKAIQTQILNDIYVLIFRPNHQKLYSSYTPYTNNRPKHKKIKLQKYILKDRICKTCNSLKLVLANSLGWKAKHHKTNKKYQVLRRFYTQIIHLHSHFHKMYENIETLLPQKSDSVL